MTEVKSLLKSKTLWGIVVSALAFFAGKYFNVEISEMEQAEIVDLLVTLAVSGGLLFAAFGRVVANKKLK